MKMAHRELGTMIAPAAVRRARSEEYPVLSMTMRGGLVDQADKFKKRIASADTSSYKVVRRAQLVVGFPIDEGVLAFQELYDEAIVSPAYNIWDIKAGSPVDRKYLERFLRSPSALAFYRSKLRSTTARRRSLPDDLFLSLSVPLPPMPEQQRIVAMLEQADTLRELRAAADRGTATIVPALFQEMFGEFMTANKICRLEPFGSLLAEPLRNGVSPAVEGRYAARVLTLAAITGSVFSGRASKEACFAQQPDKDNQISSNLFLICRGNGNRNLVGCGKFPVQPESGIVFPDTMIAAKPLPGRILPQFLEAAWQQAIVRNQIQAGARTTNGSFKINQKVIEEVRLPVPELPLQKVFAERVAEIRELEAAQAASRSRLEDLIQSMLHRAFTGDL